VEAGLCSLKPPSRSENDLALGERSRDSLLPRCSSRRLGCAMRVFKRTSSVRALRLVLALDKGPVPADSHPFGTLFVDGFPEKLFVEIAAARQGLSGPLRGQLEIQWLSTACVRWRRAARC
jgi:hypothetical protein